MAFIDERIPVGISYGSGGMVRFKTDIAKPVSGKETRTPLWSQAEHSFSFLYDHLSENEGEYLEIKEWFMACLGMAHTFRARDWGDYKSCLTINEISALDQVIGFGDGVTTDFQLIKTYTKGGQSLVRNIDKPVAGTTLISLDDVTYTGGWTADTTTGVVSFDDITRTIISATLGASCTMQTSANHGLITGDSVYFTTFTGDWAALNGSRYSITKVNDNAFSFVEDTSGFTAYSSNGGQIDTLPQAGEVIKAGFEFDVHVRFDTDELPNTFNNFRSMGMDIPLQEVKDE